MSALSNVTSLLFVDRLLILLKGSIEMEFLTHMKLQFQFEHQHYVREGYMNSHTYLFNSGVLIVWHVGADLIKKMPPEKILQSKLI